MGRAIFYTLQNSGAYAGACVCDRTHQMEKTDSYIILTYNSPYNKNKNEKSK